MVLPEVLHGAVPRVLRRRLRALRPHLPLGARAARATAAAEARHVDARADDDDGPAQRRPDGARRGAHGRRRRDDDHDGAHRQQRRQRRRGRAVGHQRRVDEEGEALVMVDAREEPYR